MPDADPRPLTATLDVAAAPDRVWDVVSDVRRTPEWSPECHRVVPVGRRRRPRLLLGFNRRGRVRWATLSWVTRWEPGHAVAWVVLTNRSVWTYELTAAGAATRVRQTRRTPRGESRFALWFTGRLLGGQHVHDDELEAGMQAGLARISRLATGQRPPTRS